VAGKQVEEFNGKSKVTQDRMTEEHKVWTKKLCGDHVVGTKEAERGNT